MKRLFSFLLLFNLGSCLVAQNTPPPPVSPRAVEAASGSVGYIRYLSEGNDPDRLQTAVVRFEKGNTMEDLVAVVHLGDAAYYENLNQWLKGYDKVLYEMVGGEIPPKGEALEGDQAPDKVAAIHSLQTLAKSFLGLEFQLDGIDYEAANFVHADVNWDEINELMSARNDRCQAPS